jgi:hypothetical protein
MMALLEKPKVVELCLMIVKISDFRYFLSFWPVFKNHSNLCLIMFSYLYNVNECSTAGRNCTVILLFRSRKTAMLRIHCFYLPIECFILGNKIK